MTISCQLCDLKRLNFYSCPLHIPATTYESSQCLNVVVPSFYSLCVYVRVCAICSGSVIKVGKFTIQNYRVAKLFPQVIGNYNIRIIFQNVHLVVKSKLCIGCFCNFQWYY